MTIAKQKESIRFNTVIRFRRGKSGSGRDLVGANGRVSCLDTDPHYAWVYVDGWVPVERVPITWFKIIRQWG
jgi:hypothetical protein